MHTRFTQYSVSGYVWLVDSAGRALHEEVLAGEVSLRYSAAHVNSTEKERYRNYKRLLHECCEWNRGALTEPISREG